MKKFSLLSYYLIFSILVFPITIESQTNSPTTHTVMIRNYAFVPNDIQIEIGDTVIFQWESGASGHNVEQVGSSKDTSYDTGGFRSGNPQNGPANWTLPSKYTQTNVTLFYICNPHLLSHNMRGQIVVGGGSDDTASGANITFILAIFLGTGVFTVGIIALLQRQKKSG